MRCRDIRELKLNNPPSEVMSILSWVDVRYRDIEYKFGKLIPTADG